MPHPHGSVISADAFARGVIRSGTDYSVYADGARMQGLDLAFYKGRSKYHTKYDSIPFTDGGKKSLWSMMEAARGAGIALANNEKTHSSRFDTPVYFDRKHVRCCLLLGLMLQRVRSLWLDYDRLSVDNVDND